MDIIVVSIGALSKNPLWNERAPVRSSHATTTLIRTMAEDGKREMLILVDPSLPGEILDARLSERAGIRAAAVTDVFLTNWRPVHRRGIEHFTGANWWMSEAEIEAATAALDAAEEVAERQNTTVDIIIEKERALLARVKGAPDALAEGVDLFPLPGYTPGQCGLILSEAARTIVIAGDAVPTAAHFLVGQVFPDCWDLEKAKASLVEMYEVTDMVIPGHDNLFVTPRAGMA